MARTKNRPTAARSASAARAAQEPAPVPGTGPAAGSPAAAVHAALAASPGATTAVIADAAGIGRPAARDALLAMEQAGTATRDKGGKPGIPDIWTLAGNGQADDEPALDPHDEQDGQPGDGTEAAEGTGQDDTAEPVGSAQHDGEDAEAGTSVDAPDPEPAREAQPGDGTAAGDLDVTAPGEPDDEAVPEGGDGPQGEDAPPADDDGEGGDAPDPALVMEVTEFIAQIKAAADAAAIVLTAGGNLRAALAGLDEVCEQAAQARRSLKAAIGGRTAPATRPGGLRERVLAHLDAHPEGEFTRTRSTRCSATPPGRSPTPWTPWSSTARPSWPPRSRAGSAGPPGRQQPPPGRTTRTARRTARTWRVPRDDPRRRPGRRHAAPAPRPRAQAAVVVRAAALGVRRRRCNRAAARCATPAPAASRRAVGTRLRADPRPRRRAARHLPERPGPGFDPQGAMGTDLDEPVIIASITADGSGEPVSLLTGRCHRLYKAARLGREHLPSLVLTTAETLAIRHDAILGPARSPAWRRRSGKGSRS